MSQHDQIVALLYELLRTHLPASAVEQLVIKASRGDVAMDDAAARVVAERYAARLCASSFARAIREMERVYSDFSLSWEETFDGIFRDEVSCVIEAHFAERGIDFCCADPDMDYEDDVTAYYNAVMATAKRHHLLEPA